MKTKSSFERYTHFISREPSYYGSGCTQEHADWIVKSLGNLIRGEFPGIDIRPFIDGDGSGKTTGPDEEVCNQIDQWVADNWEAAL